MSPPSNPAVVVAPDGVRLATTHWEKGIAGPRVVFVHGTGFCKEVAAPIVADLAMLTAAFRAVAFDQRAHGDSSTPDFPIDWWDFGRDVLAVLHGETGAIGVGHSAGGAAIMMAEILAPGTFARMVLVEPILLPPPYGRFPGHSVVVVARRRRDRFATREEAYEQWRSKEPFSSWDDRALRHYVSGGLRPEGGEFVLKCTREAEAQFYLGSTEHRAWERIGEIATPVLIVAGEHSTTHPPALLRALTERLPAAEVEVVPGASHLVWMEQPGEIARRVADAVTVCAARR